MVEIPDSILVSVGSLCLLAFFRRSRMVQSDALVSVFCIA